MRIFHYLIVASIFFAGGYLFANHKNGTLLVFFNESQTEADLARANIILHSLEMLNDGSEEKMHMVLGYMLMQDFASFEKSEFLLERERTKQNLSVFVERLEAYIETNPTMSCMDTVKGKRFECEMKAQEVTSQKMREFFLEVLEKEI